MLKQNVILIKNSMNCLEIELNLRAIHDVLGISHVFHLGKGEAGTIVIWPPAGTKDVQWL